MSRIKKYADIVRRKFFFYVVWRIAFIIGSLKPVNQKLVVFAYSKNYTSLPDNMAGLYDNLKSRGYDCVIWATPQSAVKRIISDIKFQLVYAQAKCVFITDNFDPLYSNKPRQGTKVIQLWHACGAFKRWGYSTLNYAWGGDKKEMLLFPKHNTYTDVFVSAEAVKPCYVHAFRCKTNVVKAMGTPRTDVYFDSEFVASQREKLIEKFPQIGDRKIILYAPTFRGNSPEKSYNENKLDFDKLKNKFGSEYALVLKLHPFTARKFSLTSEEKEKYGDFVFNASDMPIETVMCASDLLIADYSSLIFEYALLKRPMLFYAYDLEEYDRDRSFYFEYTDFVPGKIVKTNDEIVSAIESNDFEEQKIAGFVEKYMSACDGKSVERIADYAVE